MRRIHAGGGVEDRKLEEDVARSVRRRAAATHAWAMCSFCSVHSTQDHARGGCAPPPPPPSPPPAVRAPHKPSRSARIKEARRNGGAAARRPSPSSHPVTDTIFRSPRTVDRHRRPFLASKSRHLRVGGTWTRWWGPHAGVKRARAFAGVDTLSIHPVAGLRWRHPMMRSGDRGGRRHLCPSEAR